MSLGVRRGDPFSGAATKNVAKSRVILHLKKESNLVVEQFQKK
jgi:hypothetical protein